ncbi:MAG: hypothetical protein EOM54_11985 [Clostridia bacterium]|nr:hypothetical protein [Clostridia bacterium]
MTIAKRVPRMLCAGLLIILIFSTMFIQSYATDTNEPNDSYSTSTTLSLSNLTAYSISYISTSSDVDWYKIYITHLGLYSLALTNNSSGSSAYGGLPGDYDIYVYNSSLSQIASSCSRTTIYENSYFNITSPGYYYFKVVGYNGSYNANIPYKLIVQHGDAMMMTEACRYRDYSTQGFFDHLYPYNYWHSQGVAYSYGNKDSFSYYISNITTATTYAITPFSSWNCYSSSYRRPGLLKSEYDSGYSPINYCGIDCSGFLQRCAQAAGSRYEIARDKPLNSTNGGINAVSSGGFADWSTELPSTSALQTGHIAYNSSHIVMFAKVDPNNLYNCVIIEAAGKTLANGGRVVMESSFAYYTGTDFTYASLDT